MGVSSCCEQWFIDAAANFHHFLYDIAVNLIVIQRWKLIRVFLSNLHTFLLTQFFRAMEGQSWLVESHDKWPDMKDGEVN